MLKVLVTLSSFFSLLYVPVLQGGPLSMLWLPIQQETAVLYYLGCATLMVEGGWWVVSLLS